MPKRKVDIPFVDGFSLPSVEDVQKAIGSFPWTTSAAKLCKRQQSLLAVSDESTTSSSIDQCDNERLYSTKCRMGTPLWKPLPPPIDELAWLATVNEEGQTFDQYVTMVTLRSGQLKPNTCYENSKIYIVPIVDHHELPSWPNHGPSLDGLAAWMSAFFAKEVHILDFVTLRPAIQGSSRKRAAKDKILWNSRTRDSRLAGRICQESGRYQTHVDGLLSALLTMKEDETDGNCDLSDAFTVVGVTMCDLYSCAADLFVAGMAAGGSKVAVLSFARYHPMLKMCPEKWQSYGYVAKSSNYSYFEDNKRRPHTSAEAPSLESMSFPARAEFFRRAGKLLIHEMCHVYGIDHCVHYHCLMNGTAHLVEDFASPCHICCVCLRKLQFRLGFDVASRYEALREVYSRFGMNEQVRWAQRRLASLEVDEDVIDENKAEKLVSECKERAPLEQGVVQLKRLKARKGNIPSAASTSVIDLTADVL